MSNILTATVTIRGTRPHKSVQQGIYRIRNTVNGKCYIGSAINIVKRWNGHKHLLRKGRHHSPKLQRGWDAYGEDSFLFEVIEMVADKESLVSREQFHIDLNRPWYNCLPKAGSCLGRKHSDETRAKIAETNRGQKRTIEARLKMSKAKKGATWTQGAIVKRIRTLRTGPHYKRVCELLAAYAMRPRPPMSEAARRRISDSHRGKKLSEAHKRNLSEAARGKKHTSVSRDKMKEARARLFATGFRMPPLSPEHRQILKNANTGSKRSQETCKKIGDAHRGKHISHEHRQRVSEANKGRALTEEHRRKMSEAQKRRQERIRQDREASTPPAS